MESGASGSGLPSFRKPSFTVYALDFSGSMEGQGQQQLTKAMQTLLDQEEAS